ncbi:MAG: hypothetical protein IJ649_01935, partial [Oscillospiraceae bacterium]|nr:hypothetical protein [Oscillospiraceae bacterium]
MRCFKSFMLSLPSEYFDNILSKTNLIIRQHIIIKLTYFQRAVNKKDGVPQGNPAQIFFTVQTMGPRIPGTPRSAASGSAAFALLFQLAPHRAAGLAAGVAGKQREVPTIWNGHIRNLRWPQRLGTAHTVMKHRA